MTSDDADSDDKLLKASSQHAMNDDDKNFDDDDIDEDTELKIEGCDGIDDAEVLAEVALVPHPPDGGYGWVIVFCSFMANMIVDGITYSYGMFFDHIQNAFNCSRSETALVGSLLAGCYLIVGPIVSGLVNKFGSRIVMIAGSVVATCGLFCCVFAQSIIAMMILYGIVGGVGFGLIYLPAIVHVGFYFERKRAIATGISVAGSGVGTFAFAPLAVFLLSEYKWTGAMWILAGFVFNCCVFAALMRPLSTSVKLPDNIGAEDETNISASQAAGLMTDGKLETQASMQQLSEARRKLLQTLSASRTSHSRLVSVCSAMDGMAADISRVKRQHTRATASGAAADSSARGSPDASPSLSVSNSVSGGLHDPTAATKQRRRSLQRMSRVRSGTSESAPSDSHKDLFVQRTSVRSVSPQAPVETSVLPASPQSPPLERPDVSRDADEKSPLASAATVDGGLRLREPGFNASLAVLPEGKIVQGEEKQKDGLSVSPSLLAKERNGSTGGFVEVQRQESLHSSRPQFSRLTSRLSQQGPLAGANDSRLTAHSYAESLYRLTSMQSTSFGSLASIAPSTVSVRPKEFSRPMYRQDILYAGSITHLPEFKQSQSNISTYLTRTTSIPQRGFFASDELVDGTARSPDQLAEAECCKFIPKPVRDIMGEMMDVTLLKNPFMILYSLSNIFSMLAFYVPFVYVSNRAIENHIHPTQAAFLLSYIGVANTLGRVIFGWLSDRQWLSALTINNICLLICGCATIFYAYIVSYAGMVVYAIVFGFFVSAHISLTSIILVDYLGLEKLTNSFGLLILFRGIACMAGTPVGGAFYEMTLSYDASFIFAGLLMCVASAVSFLIPLFARFCARPTSAKEVEAASISRMLPSPMDATTLGPRSDSRTGPMKKYSVGITDLPVLLEDLAENDRTIGRLSTQGFKLDFLRTQGTADVPAQINEADVTSIILKRVADEDKNNSTRDELLPLKEGE